MEDPLIALLFSGFLIISLCKCIKCFEVYDVSMYLVVFVLFELPRGFQDDSDKIQINTDSRTHKVLSLFPLCLLYLLLGLID